MTKNLNSIPVRAGLVPSIEGTSVDLTAYLGPINDPMVVASLGSEREVYADDRFLVTHGEKFQHRSAVTQGMRYLYRENDQVVGCLHITRVNRETVASNIVVRDDMQRRGIATALVQRVLEDFPRLVLDDSMSAAGAALFGRLPEETRVDQEQSQTKSAARSTARP